MGRRFLVGVLCAFATASAASADGGQLTARYDLSIAGLPAGEAHLSASIDGNRYKINVNAKLGGVAVLAGGGAGSATASGSLAAARPSSGGYAVNSRTSRRQASVQIAFSRGRATKTVITPASQPNPKRVPITDAHRRGVIDPLSALLMPIPAGADPASAACNRSLPVFDGGGRYDIPLSFAEVRTVSVPGYAGPVYVCNARYVPIAGHRPDRDETTFMTSNRDLQVWLAPIEGTRVLAPWKIVVGLPVGRLVIEASRFKSEPETAQAKAN